MAVQARHQYFLAHAFPHDSRRAVRPEVENASALELVGGHLPTAAAVAQLAGCGNTAFSDLTCNTNNVDGGDSCFVPRKRARVGDVAGAGLVSMDGHGALLAPLPAFQAAGDAQQQQSCRALCSAAASTSGRAAPAASHGLLSLLYRHTVEVDALVRTENERLRAGLQEARRRHVRTVVSALERAAARRLRGIEAELERAVARNAELEERLRQTSAEGQAWQGAARSHEAVAAGLRATIDQLMMQSPRSGAEGEGLAEDAQSCCFEEPEENAHDAAWTRRACKACGGADACVLLLPCRHLCLCAACDATAMDACPVCAATKNASLHVLLC